MCCLACDRRGALQPVAVGSWHGGVTKVRMVGSATSQQAAGVGELQQEFSVRLIGQGELLETIIPASFLFTRRNKFSSIRQKYLLVCRQPPSVSRLQHSAWPHVTDGPFAELGQAVVAQPFGVFYSDQSPRNPLKSRPRVRYSGEAC